MARSRWTALAASVVLASGALAGCSSDSGGRTEVEFFQFKPEAVGTFDTLIAEFEEQYPDIDIVQNNVPSPDAALRTRLVKNDVPPLMTLNGNGAGYGDLAKAGIFRDFTGTQPLSRITDASIEVLNNLGQTGEETNGVPYANNADGILYNREIFDRLDLQVPTTWDELIATAEKAKAAGVTPFYLTWKEAWTTLPPFNPLAQDIPPDDFWELRQANETTFSEAWPPVMDALLQLKELGPDDPFRFDYNTGNRAMAEGEAAMYPQGIWAIPSIRAINEDIDLGTFVLPTTNDPERNRLVSGVDLLFTMPREPTSVDEEAMTFIEWMTEPEQAAFYAQEQAFFSAVQGIPQEDPALASLNAVFDSGNVVGFADHNLPSSIPLANLIQGAMITGEVEAMLKDLDKRYDAVAKRRGEAG